MPPFPPTSAADAVPALSFRTEAGAPRRLAPRLVAMLLAAVLPLAVYLAVSAEATRHATLGWLETELQDAAAQAAVREAAELARVGRLMQAGTEELAGMPVATLCGVVRQLLEAASVPITAIAVHRGDAVSACGSVGAAQVGAALAAGGAITMAGDAQGGLLLARAIPAGDGTVAVLTVGLEAAHLPPLGLPLRRDQAGRLLVDPDDGMVLVAMPGHAARAGQGLGMPRLLAALRGSLAGVAQARDAAGERRLVGHAALPLADAGVRFAGRAALLIDLPYDALVAEADMRRRDQLVAAGTLAALGALIAWLMARRWLLRPLLAEGEEGAGAASHEARALAALRPAGTWLRHQGDLAAVADAAGEMFLRLDPDLRVTFASSATRALLGYAPAEVEDAELTNEPGWEACLVQIAALRQGEMSPAPSRFMARRRDDGEVALEVRARRLADGGFMLACRDVGVEMALQRELEEAQQGLAALSLTDKLTGLANRKRFEEALAQELGRARRAQEPISLVLLRLEDWPGCAAKLGALQAEAALQQIGRLLTGVLRRPGDFAARLDEALFAVLLPTTDRIGAQRVAERVREAVGEAWRQLSHAGLAARIGAGSVLPIVDGGDPADGLLALAERALREEEAARGTALLTPRLVAAGAAEALQAS